MQTIFLWFRPFVFGVSRGVTAFLTICWSSKRQTLSFTDVVLNEREFENAFKDSGYWDSFLLVLADRVLRSVIVFSLSSVSSYGIFEKASHLLYRGFAHVALISPTSVNMQLGELLVTLGCVVVLVLAACIGVGVCLYF